MYIYNYMLMLCSLEETLQHKLSETAAELNQSFLVRLNYVYLLYMWFYMHAYMYMYVGYNVRCDFSLYNVYRRYWKRRKTKQLLNIL